MSTPASLSDIVRRTATPQPWAEGDNIPWNDPAFSARMLKEHLTPEHDLASRRSSLIDSHVVWLFDEILGGKPGHVLDLACGPGLYAQRLARKGCSCAGIDFGPASIEYARAQAEAEELDCTFVEEDLRTAAFGRGFDLVRLLYGQVNVFERDEARDILERAFDALEPGGRLVLEPQRLEAVRGSGEPSATWSAAESGLFSKSPHILLHEVFWDEKGQTRTDRWHVVDANTARVERHAMSCVAWERHELEAVLRELGFATVETLPGLLGADAEPDELLFALVADKPTTR